VDQQPQEQRVPVLEQDPQEYVYEDYLDPVQLSDDQGVSNLEQISEVVEEQPLIEPVSQPRRPTSTQQSNRGGGGQFRPLGNQRRSRRPPIDGASLVN